VSGGFDVPAAVGKLKLLLRTGIKLRWISDLVLQRFVYETEDSVHPDLPLGPRVMNCDPGTHLAFGVSCIVRDDDRSGLRIRRKQGCEVTHAAWHAQQHVRRKGMRIADLAAGFLLRGILAL